MLGSGSGCGSQIGQEVAFSKTRFKHVCFTDQNSFLVPDMQRVLDNMRKTCKWSVGADAEQAVGS